MQIESGQHEGRYHLKLDGAGRLRLPQVLRDRFGLEGGTPILLVEQDDHFLLETAEQSLSRAQDHFASIVPKDVSLVDELLDERRQEAERE